MPESLPPPSSADRPPRKRAVRRRKVVTTVNLEPTVRAYLDVLMARHDRDRSYLVNALIKQHMRNESAADLPAQFPPQAD